jgi:hypothetical protein
MRGRFGIGIGANKILPYKKDYSKTALMDRKTSPRLSSDVYTIDKNWSSLCNPEK